jgi:hypothetical protein
MTHRLKRFVQLSKSERGALVEASLALIAARASLAIGGFNRLHRLNRERSSRERSSNDRGNDAARAHAFAVAIVRAANNLPLRTTCLDRALALYWLLRLHKIGGTVRVGVREGEGLQAHAWVEHAGEVLYDDEAESYQAFEKPLFQ